MFGSQADDAAPGVKTALTAVILQAAIADPDLVHAHLADHKCWPALLAICTPQPSAAARQYAQLCSQLWSNCSMSTSVSANACSEMTQEQKLHSQDSAVDRKQAMSEHQAAGTASQDGIWQKAHQQSKAAEERATDAAVAAEHCDAQGLLAAHVQAATGAASHVAQLIICLLQSQPARRSPPEAFSGVDSLKALLHCYVVHTKTACQQLSAPVWPAQARRQQQQHLMLQHVAQAGQCSRNHMHCSRLWS